MRRFAILVLVLATGCGESVPPPPPRPTLPAAPPTAPAAPPPVAEAPLRTGTVEGIVRVDSTDIAPLTGSVLGFEKYCGKGPLDTGLYKVDAATKGLTDAFVEADGRCAPYKPAGVPTLDQKACLFTPTILVARPGPVIFKNSDGMSHNITLRGRLNPHVTDGFPGGEAISRTFAFEEKMPVRCSIHPWMMAGLVVTRRSAHAVTDSFGSFRIENVEAGRRTIKVWHLLADEVSVQTVVPEGGTAQVEIRWKPRPGFRTGFNR